jgi:cytochrome c551/c552
MVAFTVNAEHGNRAVFDSLRCGTCHKLDTGKINPSLKEIPQAYKGKENQLLSYLKGAAESVVNPEKGATLWQP